MNQQNPRTNLLLMLAEKLRESLLTLNALPQSDPYWYTTSSPRHQNFDRRSEASMITLQDYLTKRYDNNRDDENALWGLIAIEVLHYCNNSFGGQYWVPLVRKNIRNLRLMIESANHVHASSGVETRGLLGKFLHELAASAPSFKSALEEMSKNDSNDDSRYAAEALENIRAEEALCQIRKEVLGRLAERDQSTRRISEICNWLRNNLRNC